MSNIRLNTIVPDIVNNSSGVITLPGSLSVATFSSLSTLDATSPSLASVTIAGGVGIAKGLSLGGNLQFNPSATDTHSIIHLNTISGSDDKSLILTGAGKHDVDASRGAFIALYGNQSQNGNVRLSSGLAGSISLSTGLTNSMVISSSGSVTLNGNQPSTSSTSGALVLSAGGLSINNTTDATSLESGGALTVSGGMSIKGTVYLGNVTTISGILNASAGVHISATQDATGTLSGSLSTSGGASVSKNIFVGGMSNLLGDVVIGGTMSLSSTSDTSISLAGGLSVSKGITVSGQTNLNAGLSISGVTLISNVTETLGATNGALVVNGGVGIGKSLRVSGSLHVDNGVNQNSNLVSNTWAGVTSFTNIADSTSLSDAAVVISGGVSISKSLRIGLNAMISGNITISGSSTLNSITTTGNVLITATTQSTSPETGSLVISGGLGLSGAFHSSGIVVLSNSIDSTSTSSGTLVLSNGGLGVAKSVNIGTSLSVGGTSMFTGVITADNVNVNGVLLSNNTVDSTSATSGSVILAGGLGISKRLYIGSSLNVTGSSVLSGSVAVNNILSISDTTESSSLSSASLVTLGGISVAKSLRIGSNLIVSGNTTANGTVSLLSSTPSTNATTGALVVTGGAGIGGAVHLGNSLSVTGSVVFMSTSSFSGTSTFLNATDATSTGGSIVTTGGISVGKGVHVNSFLTVLGSSTLGDISSSGTLTLSNTTESSSFNTGAVVISGGMGIAGNFNTNGNSTITGNVAIGGICSFTNATDSPSLTIASAKFSGGVAITKNLNVGGGFSVTASSTFTGPMTNTVGSFTLNNILMTDLSGYLYTRSSTPGIRVAGNDAVKGTQYGNALDLFSLGNSYTDINLEALQITTTSTNTYTVLSRANGSGILRRLALQTGSNTNQLLLNIDGSIVLGPSTSTIDSVSPSTGSVVVSSGLGVKNSLSIGGSLRVFGSGSGNISINAPSTVTSYILTLPSTIAPANNYALVSDTSGNLSWSQMTTPNPTFQTVVVTGTTPSTSPSTGALTVSGGLGVSGQAFLGNNLILNGTSGSNFIVSSINGTNVPTYNTRSVGTRFVVYPAVSSTFVDSAIGVQNNYMWFSSPNPNADGFKWYSGTKNTLTLEYNGNLLTAAGASIVLSGSTSGSLTLVPPATVSSYSLHLPPSLPNASNMALVTDVNGILSWSEMITPNPNFVTVGITSTTPNTGLGTGALVVSGGTSIGSGLSLKGPLKLVGTTAGVITINPPATNDSPTFTLPPNVPSSPGQFLKSDTDGNLTWGSAVSTSSYSAPLSNNVTSPTMINGLSFKTPFKIDVSVNTTTTTENLGALYTLRGTQTSLGWKLFEHRVGDDTGVIFSIDSSGNITYTSNDMVGWTGSTVKWTGPDIYSPASGNVPQSVPGANNQTTFANITGFVVNPPQFSRYLLVTINNTTVASSSSTLYLLQGTQQQNGSWNMTVTSVAGPDPGFRFSITSGGQIQYTSPDIPGWLSTSFAFDADTKELQLNSAFASLEVTSKMNVSGTSTIQNLSKSAVTFGTGALNVAGDVVVSSGDFVFGESIVGPPTNTTRSPGTRIILSPSLGSSTNDYAIGLDADALWQSLENSSRMFRWYGGISKFLELTNSGLVLPSSTGTGFIWDNGAGLLRNSTDNQYVNNSTVGDIVLRTSSSPTGVGNIRFGTSSNSNLDILQNGNVVVKSTSDVVAPSSAPLQILGGTSIAKTLTVGSSKSGDSIGVLKLMNLNGAGNDRYWMGFCHGGLDAADTNDRARFGVDITPTGAGRLFWTTGNANSQVQRMFLDENGYLTIGGTTPSATLTVGNGIHDLPSSRSTICLRGASTSPEVKSTPGMYHRSTVGLSLFTDNAISMEVNGSSGTLSEALRITNTSKVILQNIGENGMFSVNSPANDTQASSSLNTYSGNTIFGPAYSSTTGSVVFYSKHTDGSKRIHTLTSSSTLFTGQHLNYMEKTPSMEERKEYVGKIVASQGKYATASSTGQKITGKSAIQINEALPYITLSSKDKQKNVFGVITDSDNEHYKDAKGNIIYDYVDNGFENGVYDRIRVNSVGEGAIWVCNVNGTLQNGDYITTTSVLPGYGVKQDDDLLHNYTVAKITCDCDFDLNSQEYICKEVILENGNVVRCAFVGCTYHCG